MSTHGGMLIRRMRQVGCRNCLNGRASEELAEFVTLRLQCDDLVARISQAQKGSDMIATADGTRRSVPAPFTGEAG